MTTIKEHVSTGKYERELSRAQKRRQKERFREKTTAKQRTAIREARERAEHVWS